MVAYSFQTRFLEPIRSGEKQQTIRLPRKRHARPGEAVQMFNGPRFKPTRVGACVCQAVHDVTLNFQLHRVELDDSAIIEDPAALDAFAIRDGFRPPAKLAALPLPIGPWEYLARFWVITHPDQPIFRGVLVDWGSTFEAAS